MSDHINQPNPPDGTSKTPLRSTLAHVDNVQNAPDHPSWNNLFCKVCEFLRSRFSGATMPTTWTFDDFLGNTLERLFRALQSYEKRADGSFWGWVHRLAENEIRDGFRYDRAAKRGGGQAVASLNGATGHPTELPDPAGQSVSHDARCAELDAAIWDSLAQLPEETAEVLRLRLIENFDFESIALAVGRRKVVTVRAIFARGRARLIERLRQRGFDEQLFA